jgi:ribosomal protein L21
MKAVVKVGGKQYIVAEKETLLVDRLQDGTKELALDALLTIDGDKTVVGTPLVKGRESKRESRRVRSKRRQNPHNQVQS